MIPDRHLARVRTPLALAILAGVGGVLIVLALRTGARPAASPPPAANPEAPVERSAPAAVEPVDERVASGTAFAAVDADAPFGQRDASAVPVTARKERDMRDEFVRRERAEPGCLAREAAALLASDGPATEKVALLRALEDVGSPELAHWLEQAVLVVADVATPQAESVPSFAVGRLHVLAARDREARLALRRLAFEQRALSLALRSRAAAAAAAWWDANELVTLANDLHREPDTQVVRSALAALRSRRAEYPVQRVLEAFDEPAEEPPADGDPLE